MPPLTLNLTKMKELKRTPTAFKMNRNGKPITKTAEQKEETHYQGATMKLNGTYYFYVGKRLGNFVYEND